MGRPAAVGVFYWDSGEVPTSWVGGEARPVGVYEPAAVGVWVSARLMARTKNEAICARVTG